MLAESACGILLACAGVPSMSSGAELMTTELWVSVEDVAEHLGGARNSVYRGIDGRGLPADELGRLGTR